MSKEKTNQEIYAALSGDKQRKVQFLVSRGAKLVEALAKVTKTPLAEPKKADGTKKETAKEKKARLAGEIQALGGEVPADGASVAKFEEALTTAKAAKDAAGEGTDGAGEGTDGAEDLM